MIESSRIKVSVDDMWSLSSGTTVVIPRNLCVAERRYSIRIGEMGL